MHSFFSINLKRHLYKIDLGEVERHVSWQTLLENMDVRLFGIEKKIKEPNAIFFGSGRQCFWDTVDFLGPLGKCILRMWVKILHLWAIFWQAVSDPLLRTFLLYFKRQFLWEPSFLPQRALDSTGFFLSRKTGRGQREWVGPGLDPPWVQPRPRPESRV